MDFGLWTCGSVRTSFRSALGACGDSGSAHLPVRQPAGPDPAHIPGLDNRRVRHLEGLGQAAVSGLDHALVGGIRPRPAGALHEREPDLVGCARHSGNGAFDEQIGAEIADYSVLAFDLDFGDCRAGG